MYVPYISDITRQIEEVVKIFAMEKELRLIKNRGYFLIPQLAPKECKIETMQDKETLIKEIDKIALEMLNAIRESEENYRKEQEQARVREEPENTLPPLPSLLHKIFFSSVESQELVSPEREE